MGKFVFQISDESKPYVSGIIFVVSLIFICSRPMKFMPIGRTGAAIIGSVLMCSLGIVPPSEIGTVVNWDTLILLMSMMMLSGYMENAKIWDLAKKLLKARCESPHQLLIRVCIISAVMSSVLTNDTVCVTITPIVVSLCKSLKLPLFPFLMAIATSANIGSSSLPVGNPQNMIISTTSNLNFFTFFKVSITSAALGTVINTALLYFYFKKDLQSYSILEKQQDEVEIIENSHTDIIELREINSISIDNDLKASNENFDENFDETNQNSSIIVLDKGITLENDDEELLNNVNNDKYSNNFKQFLNDRKNSIVYKKCQFILEILYRYRPLVALGLILSGFFAGFHMGFTVFLGVSLLILIERKDVNEILHSVDWELLVFFAGLFIIVDGFDREFAVYAWKVLEKWVPVSVHDSVGIIIVFVIIVLGACNVLGNVPLVLSLCPRFLEENVSDFTWLLLAFISTVAGNLTLVGSVANLIVAEKSKYDYPIGFYEYTKFGAPATIIVIAICTPLIIFICLI